MNQIIDQTISWDKIGKHEKSEYTYSLGKAVVSRGRKTLTINIELNFIIPHGDLAPLKQEIKNRAPDIKDVLLCFHYRDMILTPHEAVDLYIPYMIEAANGEHAAITRAILNNEHVLSENELVLFALGDIAASKLNESAAAIFEKKLSENIGIQRKIRFENHKGQYEKAKKQKGAAEEQEIAEIKKSGRAVNAKADKKPYNAKGAGRGGIIKPVKGSAVKLADITPESGNVVVEGELFKKSHRTIKKDRKSVV